MFTLTKDGSRPLNTTPRSFVSSLPRSVTLTRKHDSLFSITYTPFSTHNSAHLFCFLETAHSLRKTWGVGYPTEYQNIAIAVNQTESVFCKSCYGFPSCRSKNLAMIWSASFD